MIESPLNYTGNKSRLLKQFLPLFPKKINTFFDICCGGCSVGLNVNANKIVCIDRNDFLINLLKTLQKYSLEQILNKVERIIDDYSLSYSAKNGCDIYNKYIKDNSGLKYYNEEGFLKLRKYFNVTDFKNFDEKTFICIHY